MELLCVCVCTYFTATSNKAGGGVSLKSGTTDSAILANPARDARRPVPRRAPPVVSPENGHRGSTVRQERFASAFIVAKWRAGTSDAGACLGGSKKAAAESAQTIFTKRHVKTTIRLSGVRGHTRADRRNDRVSDEMGSEPVLPREAETPVHGVRPLPAWEGETLL